VADPDTPQACSVRVTSRDIISSELIALWLHGRSRREPRVAKRPSSPWLRPITANSVQMKLEVRGKAKRDSPVPVLSATSPGEYD